MKGLPTPRDATQIAEALFGVAVAFCQRFPTGLRHWVYDIELQTGQRVVVRISDPANQAELAGAIFWTGQLRSLQVPVAKVLHHDVASVMPYMVLERLPGTDLGNTFDQLGAAELVAIATSVAHLQSRATQLPHADGYGYALDYTQSLSPTWNDVVTAEIDRAEQRIRSVGAVDPAYAVEVRARLDAWATTLRKVEPQAFLHDATTKNVIVHAGELSGLVDVDTMAFGDPLWAVALTRMSLLSARRPTLYSDALAAAMGFTADNKLLDFYTAVFCLGFLGELGQTFNKATPEPINTTFQNHLQTTLDDLLA